MQEIASPLGEGANWKWVRKEPKIKRQLEWVAQLVPLGSEQFALITQTTGIGRKGKLLGIDWFFTQIRLARRLRARLNLPGNCEAQFPVHSESAELLARMFGDD